MLWAIDLGARHSASEPPTEVASITTPDFTRVPVPQSREIQ
jgi:hypothetical protein